MAVTFDIVIPTYGQRSTLDRTLATLAGEDLPDALKFVHVVENGPRMGAEKVCMAYKDVLPIQYHYEEPPGASGARNVGIRASSSQYIIFLDDDIRPVPGAIHAYEEAFVTSGVRSFFGGPLIPDYDKPPPQWLIEFLPDSAKGFALGSDPKTVDAPTYFLGGNWAVPRSAFDEVGLFEGPSATGVRGGGLGEEDRLQKRMRAAGYLAVYVPSAGALHFVPENRCNKAFVRRRRWRTGYGDGELVATEPGHHRIVFGAPAWFWRRALAACWNYAKILRPGNSNEERFRRLLGVYYGFGRIQGYWHGARSRGNVPQRVER